MNTHTFKTTKNNQSNQSNNRLITIDGSHGEGGGQIIRSALTLSMLTGTPIHLTNIRAGRKKSGLMRQHLVCVQAAKALCDATVTGDTLRSGELTFTPSASLFASSVHGSDSFSASDSDSDSDTALTADTLKKKTPTEYHFDIGSAGSTTLVFQTLWAMLAFHPAFASAPIRLRIIGGTHNPLAPSSDFILHSFIPALARMGIHIEFDCLRAGYAPVGGGEVVATIHPRLPDSTRAVSANQSAIQSTAQSQTQPTTHLLHPNFSLVERGALERIDIFASSLNLKGDVAMRELSSCQEELLNSHKTHNDAARTDSTDNNIDGDIENDTDNTSKTASSQEISKQLTADILNCHPIQQNGIGDGNSLYAIIHHSQQQTVVSTLGARNRSAEQVGTHLGKLIKRYLYRSDACVEEYLSDQLLLPLALTGGGEFTATVISEHTRTQAWLLAQFLPIQVTFNELNEHKTLVKVIPIS